MLQGEGEHIGLSSQILLKPSERASRAQAVCKYLITLRELSHRSSPCGAGLLQSLLEFLLQWKAGALEAAPDAVGARAPVLVLHDLSLMWSRLVPGNFSVERCWHGWV